MTTTLRYTAIAALLIAAPAAAAVHNKLLKSAPLAGTAVAAPATISLWFSESPELALSGITLKGADSVNVKLGAVGALAGEKHAITAPVTGALKAGEYLVQYRTAGTDGHPLRGSFKFKVK